MLQRLMPKNNKKPDEANSNSLLTRAFSEEAKRTGRPTKVPVAVYKDPYANLRRKALRWSLTIVLPLVALLAIGLVTYFTLINNLTEEIIVAESVTMGNIPTPANVRRISSTETGLYINYFKNQTENYLPNFTAKTSRVENFIATNLTPNDLMNYYKTKLVDTKQWAIYKQISFKSSLDTLYARTLANRQVEITYLRVQVEGAENMKKIANSELNGTAFYLGKVLATPNQ